MNRPFRAATRISRWLTVAVLLPIASFSAWPQAHTRQVGIYSLRSSTTNSENLSEETAKAHGIGRDARRAVLNVVVLKNEVGLDTTVRAQMQAYATNLAGQLKAIDMRPVADSSRISYLGSYGFVHGEVLDFTIKAKPEGSGETLSMTYRERLWVPGLPAQ
ncbi:MAG: DUF4426 domain-containing protein [Rhodoferax sp.]|uniref:DUF4426 domain-containing protein n=1 Tax=Rhodoferax sp. TaxID=50421 RepID=UPI0014002570|nr:DUF4426 domain-containing protein [Rhodoferax sp.]NDP40625.1 DUF4426 domain-containing protein [Rhodoferax sp.]